MNQQSTLLPNTSLSYIGADVSKKTFDVALARPGQRFPAIPLQRFPAATFPRTAQGVGEFLAWLDGLTEKDDQEQQESRVVMEATGSYSTELAVWMLEQRPSLRPAIVNAYQTAAFIKSLNLRNKTDGLEARALALYGLERAPIAYEPPSPERAELRALTRYRDSLIKQKVALGNRSQDPVASAFVARSREQLLKRFNREIEKIQRQIHRVIDGNEQLKRDFDQLCTIYGVGVITAAVILAELGDLRRFERARQLTAFAGVSPKNTTSGTSVHGRPRLCKQGNPRVRQALYMAAVSAIRGKSDLTRTYFALTERGKAPKVALGALMRKLLTTMRAVLITGTPYDPNWKTCGKTPAQWQKTIQLST